MFTYPTGKTGVCYDLFERIVDGGDPTVDAFVKKLPAGLEKKIKTAWQRLPDRQKRSFGRPDARATSVPFGQAISTYSSLYKGDAEKNTRAWRNDFKKFELEKLRPGQIADRPVTFDPAVFRDFLYFFLKRMDHCCTHGNDFKNPPVNIPVKAKKVGARLSRIVCLDETGDWGDDEITLVCVVVDGNGKLTTTNTRKYSMNDGGKDEKWLSDIIYAPADPNSFLDIAISMIERDATDPQVGKTVSQIGDAIAAAGVAAGQPVIIAAGIAVEIIGGVLTLSALLQEDDHMGTMSRNWSEDVPSNAAGSHMFSYSKHGDYHYRVHFQVFSID